MGYLILMVILAIVFLVSAFVFLGNRGQEAGPAKIVSGLIAVVALILGVVATLLNIFVSIENGYGGVVTQFGRLKSTEMLPNGLHVVSPLATVISMDLHQKTIEFRETKNGNNLSIDKDNVPLAIDADFFYSLSPSLAARIYQAYGPNYETTLLISAASSSVREATTNFGWRDALVIKHTQFAQFMTDDFIANIQQKLEDKGFTKAEAKGAFIVSSVNLRQILPPDRILQANAESQAATVDLQRQETLTAIAGQEALRRGKEGEGIRNLFDNLPKGYTSQDIVNVLGGVALKTQSDALTRAVEDKKITVLPIPLQSALSINPESGVMAGKPLGAAGPAAR